MKKLISKIKNLIKNLFGKETNAVNSSSESSPQQNTITQQTSTSSINAYSSYREVKSGSTQGWYGRTNYWTKSTDILTQELDALVRHGATGYLIELAGWAGSTGKQWTDSWISELDSIYKWLLIECRKRKVWLFVSIVNDNMGRGKYGDTGPKLEKVYDYAKKLVAIVKKNGKEGVYVQAVAETQTASGKKFEQYCISELNGFNLVYNGNGGHPTSAISGMKNYAVHPSAISAKNPSNAFVVSDHGLIIRELNKGGSLSAHGDASKIKTWANNVKSTKSPVCAYYAFQVKDFDNDAIKALGNTLK